MRSMTQARRGCKFNELAFRAAKIYALSTERESTGSYTEPRGTNGTMPQKEPFYRRLYEKREDKTASALVVTSNVFIVSFFPSFLASAAVFTEINYVIRSERLLRESRFAVRD